MKTKPITKHNIFSEIYSWSKTLAPWQNETIRRLFLKRTLSSKDYDELFELAQSEYGLKPVTIPSKDLMLKENELPTAPSTDHPVRLACISEITNVNALKGEKLEIGTSLTVIYGDNASGKSGYARIMKKAFRARDVEEILPNVYGELTTPEPAEAVFDIEENGKIEPKRWKNGSPAPDCFNRFAVFDSKCARVYITGDNQLAFLPYGFDIIRGLAEATSKIKNRFKELADVSKPAQEKLQIFQDGTQIAHAIANISAKTKEEDIKALASWTEQDTETLSQNIAELSKLKEKSPDTIRDTLKADRKQVQTVLQAVRNVFTRLSDDKVKKLKDLASEHNTCKQAVKLAAEKTFRGLPIPGIGGDIWRELLCSAEKYSTEVAYPGQTFPAPDSNCLLCLRPLDTTSADRITQFWAFIQDDLSGKRDAKKEELDQEITLLEKEPTLPREVEVLEDALKAAGSKVFDLAKSYYDSILQRYSSIKNALQSDDWDAIETMPESPENTCLQEIQEIDSRISAVQDDAKIKDRIGSLTKTVSEMQARKLLKENISMVLNHIRSFKVLGNIERGVEEITTNAISVKASSLHDEFVTNEFRDGVRTELKNYKLDRVRTEIDRRAQKGKVTHKVTVQSVINAVPESVFSEGERTAIALSCFLAELNLRNDNCGIILDDPLSSFDHNVRERTVERLVLESKRRQVVIFTHDIASYRELLQESIRQETALKYQNISALGNVVGMVNDIPPWIALPVKSRVNILREELKTAKECESKGDEKGYRKSLYSFYDKLRSSWERSVEEILFGGVMQRLQRDVKTLMLDRVLVDDPAVEKIFQGMTRCSNVIEAHDHPIAENSSLPTSKDMEEDLIHLTTFIAEHNQKSKQAVERRKHLKTKVTDIFKSYTK